MRFSCVWDLIFSHFNGLSWCCHLLHHIQLPPYQQEKGHLGIFHLLLHKFITFVIFCFTDTFNHIIRVSAIWGCRHFFLIDCDVLFILFLGRDFSPLSCILSILMSFNLSSILSTVSLGSFMKYDDEKVCSEYAGGSIFSSF